MFIFLVFNYVNWTVRHGMEYWWLGKLNIFSVNRKKSEKHSQKPSPHSPAPRRRYTFIGTSREKPRHFSHCSLIISQIKYTASPELWIIQTETSSLTTWSNFFVQMPRVTYCCKETSIKGTGAKQVLLRQKFLRYFQALLCKI